MVTNNSVNSPLSGTTGTGTFVGSTSPTITTPVISSITNTGTLTFPTATGNVWASGSVNNNAAQPFCDTYLNTGVNNVTGDGTDYLIIFDTVIVDRNSNYNTSTGTFTCPATGCYLFQTVVDFQNIGALYTSGTFYVHNATSGNVYYLWQVSPFACQDSTDHVLAIGGSSLQYCLAGDVISIHIVIAGSTKSINIYGGAGDLATRFSATFLG